ncbi:MAG: hypothetical protein OXC95_12915 [Dehalococcoidia bacterium]|nr:hypothetical protein [Dehalococcoidia bacterium]
MANSDTEMIMIPKRRLERIIRDAKRASAQSKKRIEELDRRWEEMEERHRREDRGRSY